MKRMIIYFTADKKIFQIVQPTKAFDSNWKGLADHITKSGDRADEKNYSHYELV
jgi:hypothetical protein